jgi:hypothetical protein
MAILHGVSMPDKKNLETEKSGDECGQIGHNVDGHSRTGFCRPPKNGPQVRQDGKIGVFSVEAAILEADQNG